VVALVARRALVIGSVGAFCAFMAAFRFMMVLARIKTDSS
jgi:hypothetical protein